MEMKWPEFKKFNLEASTILLGVMGSHSHGTYVPASSGGIDDIDVMGICVPPIDYYIGLKKFEQVDCFEDEYDIVIYEVKKFVSLLLKSNPNVLGLLWLPDNLYLKRTDAGNILIENRNIFSSKKIYNSFTNYASSQLKKMKKFNHEGYMGKKRKELVTKFGYDTKNAAHCIRLLETGIEFLNTGQLNVMRDNSDTLVSIKLGEWDIEKVKGRAEELFEESQIALQNSTLPEEPNESFAEKLLIEIVTETIIDPVMKDRMLSMLI